MAERTEKLDAILESGVQETANKGRKVVFRSTKEIIEAKAHLSANQSGDGTGVEQIRVETGNPYWE